MVGFAKTVVAVGTFSAVAMAAPNVAWDQPRTLRFNALTTHKVLLDRGRRGLSVGDELVSVGRLVRPDGRLLGRLGTSCTVVNLDHHAAYQCDGHDSLPGGQIAFAGKTVPGKRVQVIAMTGGTAPTRRRSGSSR